MLFTYDTKELRMKKVKRAKINLKAYPNYRKNISASSLKIFKLELCFEIPFIVRHKLIYFLFTYRQNLLNLVLMFIC